LTVALLDIRLRAGYLFLAVTLGHIVLISTQVNSKSGVPILETMVFGAFAEAQRGASAVVTGVRQVWLNYIGLREVGTENARLRRELAEAQIQLQEQRALTDRARALEALLELRDHLKLSTTAAAIIAAAASPDFRTVTIDKGTDDGLRRDMAVIEPAGIVGRVVVTAARAAKVQLLVDRNAAAGALVERSRAQGVVLGVGDEWLRMGYVSETSDVVVGDAVVTSGIDGIFPKGFVIGTVDKIEKNGSAYSEIVVKPAVDFSRLEEVLVVLTPTPASEAAREIDR
jgi:rod shape-determining protein MreC